MTLLEQWEQRKGEIEAGLAEGRIEPDEAARELAHLDYRICPRPLILKQRKDRKTYRVAKALEHRAARLAAETCSNSQARSAE